MLGKCGDCMCLRWALMLIRGLLRSVPGESLEQPGLGPVSGWHTAQQQSPDVCVVPTERPFLSCAEFPVHTLLCPSLSSSSSCPSGVTGSGGGCRRLLKCPCLPADKALTVDTCNPSTQWVEMGQLEGSELLVNMRPSWAT